MSKNNNSRSNIQDTLRLLMTTSMDRPVQREAVKQVNLWISLLEEQNNQNDELIREYEKYLDEKLPSIIDDISQSINDFKSALAGVYYYNIEWFKTLPLSPQGKMKVAAVLLAQTAKFVPNYNEFWKTLQNGNPDILSRLRYRYSSFDILGYDDNIPIENDDDISEGPTPIPVVNPSLSEEES